MMFMYKDKMTWFGEGVVCCIIFVQNVDIRTNQIVFTQESFVAGLPDGLFLNQKFQIWLNLEDLVMENDIFYDHM
jgi:hypothetical protein